MSFVAANGKSTSVVIVDNYSEFNGYRNINFRNPDPKYKNKSRKFTIQSSKSEIINSIANEILNNIFKYLPLKDLCNVLLVNNQWREAGKSNFLGYAKNLGFGVTREKAKSYVFSLFSEFKELIENLVIPRRHIAFKRSGKVDLEATVFKVKTWTASEVVQIYSNNKIYNSTQSFQSTSSYLLALIDQKIITCGLPTIPNLQHFLKKAIRKKNKEILQVLFSLGAAGEVKKLGPDLLTLAIRRGCSEVVQIFLDVGMKPENNSGQFHLHLAAQQGNLEILELLLFYGKDEELLRRRRLFFSNNTVPFHLAVQIEEEVMSRLSLELRASLETKNQGGQTLLHIATLEGHLTIVQFLVGFGVNLDTKDPDGCSPLHRATLMNNFSMVQFLVGYGANIEAQNNNGETALLLASQEERNIFHYRRDCVENMLKRKNNRLDILRCLLEKGTDINHCNHKGETPVDIAFRTGADIEVIQFLIKQGAKLTKPCLPHVAIQGEVKVAQLLLDLGASWQERDEHGRTALYSAVTSTVSIKKRLEMISFVLENGADIRAPNNSGTTSLHYVVAHCDIASYRSDEIEIGIKLLKNLLLRLSIGHFVDWFIKGKQSNRLLCQLLNWAILIEHEDLFKELLSRNVNINNSAHHSKQTPLHFAACRGRISMVVLLLANGANANAQNLFEEIPLHLAAKEGHIEVAELLLQKDSFVNAKSFHGTTPLHLTAKNGCIKLVKSLLQKGANVHAEKNDSGKTPLLLASEEGHAEVVKLLLQKGSNINACNKFKETSLHLAAKEGHVEVVRILLQEGAKVNIPTRTGKTPLYFAVSLPCGLNINTGAWDMRRLQIVQLLLAHGANMEVKHTASIFEAAADCQLPNVQAFILKHYLETKKKEEESCILF